MKIQCSCGAKYTLEVTPEMAHEPVQFVCPACGVDSSSFVTELARRELESGAGDLARALGPIRVSTGGKLRIQRSEHPPANTTTETAPAQADEPVPCSRHPGQLANERCRVCAKPICPKCMELFGYVCSPLCKSRAESQSIDIPEYEGMKSVREARQWRKAGWAAAVGFVITASAIGIWFWYAWIGSVPHVAFSVRFPDQAYSGQSASFDDSIVFLHGGLLARHDLKQHKEIWARELIDANQIQEAVAKAQKQIQIAIDKANHEDPDHVPKMPSADKLTSTAQKMQQASLDLRMLGKNVWVLSGSKLTRYDWDTGRPTREIALETGFGGLIPREDELLMIEANRDGRTIRHINLVTGDSRTEEIGERVNSPIATSGKPGTASSAPSAQGGLDPSKIAEQAQHLSLAGRIAMPATLATSMNQQRTLDAMNDQPKQAKHPVAPEARPPDGLTLIPAADGFLEFSTRLIEARLVQRTAMKPVAEKSALESKATVGNTAEMSNEILNDMQRSHGGETVTDDESRYQATLKRADGKGEWTGEVVGQPSVFLLKTVAVLAANKTLIVFDSSLKKVWQSTLSYNIGTGPGTSGGETTHGEGPCVEHKNTFYVFDQGVLTAFDLKSGNVRWRFPSVGIVGLFFDDHGMVYVNTTTASPDTLKYSRQIDITQRASSVILKLDPENGRTVWAAQPDGFLSYLSGKYIYAVKSYQPDEEEDDTYKPDTGFETAPYIRIKRINPKNGKVMWEHFQQRAPLDIEFDHNSIRLVFKKEVQVLKFTAM